MRGTRTAIVAGLAAATMFGVGGAANATAAAPPAHRDGIEPMVCTHPAHSNKSGGVGSTQQLTTKIHSGPFEACSWFAVDYHTTVYYHCAMRNRYGNWWINVNYYGSSQPMNGWVYSGYVSGPWPVAHC